MKALESLPLPSLIRYGLTGMVAALLVFVSPYVLIEPSNMTKIASAEGVASLIFGGIVTGFILDAIKVYQFSPNYEDTKQKFFSNVAKIFDVPIDKARRLSSRAVYLEQSNNGGHILFQHSRWVMITTSSAIFIFSATIYTFFAIMFYFQDKADTPARLAIAALVSFVIGLRLMRTAREVRENVNNDYLFFIESNKEELLSDLQKGGDNKPKNA